MNVRFAEFHEQRQTAGMGAEQTAWIGRGITASMQLRGKADTATTDRFGSQRHQALTRVDHSQA